MSAIFNKQVRNDDIRTRAARDTGLLDSPPEEIFNELVALAASICETPIGLVSLLDTHRQWFKARVGLDVEETPIEWSFCAHAVEHSELFVVEDAARDRRFADNPLVTGAPGIGFYAGYPLSVANGEQIGTLCVIDRKPRQLTELQRKAIEVIGRQVVAQIQLKERVAALARLVEEKEYAIQARISAGLLAARERAAAAKILSALNARFRHLIEGVHDHALLTVDSDAIITSWNCGAERLLGYNEKQILNRKLSSFFTPEDCSSGVPERQIARARQDGRADDEGWRVRADGTRFWASVSKTALYDDFGQPCGFAVIIQDRSEQRRIAEAIEEMRMERVRLQDKMLSHVSHELRTPLTAVYFFTANVVDGLLGELLPEQKEHLQIVLKNVHQLTGMVDDLLDITRISTQKLTVEPHYVTAVSLISKALDTSRKKASEKNIHLVQAPGIAVRDALPDVWADAARAGQVLTNLIDNAIKFTPANGTVSVDAAPDAEDASCVRFSVSDTGPGISPEHRDLVFERLVQIKGDYGIGREGLGLGLFISREIVVQHGGRIWLESDLGHGSTFSFTLPVFSLVKLCGELFTPLNAAVGCVTLIAVDVLAGDRADRAELVPELRRALTRCIHPSHDRLLPWIGDSAPLHTFFIVASADEKGSAIIISRIDGELQNLPAVFSLEPRITSTTVATDPSLASAARIKQVTDFFDLFIRRHLQNGEHFEEAA